MEYLKKIQIRPWVLGCVLWPLGIALFLTGVAMLGKMTVRVVPNPRYIEHVSQPVPAASPGTRP